MDFSSAEAQAYLKLIDGEQDALAAALAREFPGASIHWRYRLLWNGVVLRAPKGAAARLRRLPHVLSVRSTDTRWFHSGLDASAQAVGAPEYWQAVGGASWAGRGVKVAVIDTGIDVDNPFFQDPTLSYPPGYPRGAPGYTTPKVIAARAYFRPDDPVNVSRDEPNPRDRLGHGSHVAGIVAGVAGTVFDIGGYQAEVSGVAPGALLMSYKVFYRAESGTEGAREPELMAAFEDAVGDGADVINNSWGGPDVFGDADPSMVVYQAAVDAGVVVVFAAGNEGPGDGSVGSPGQHPRFLTVANLGVGRGFTRYLEVTAPTPVPGELVAVRMTVGRISASLGSGVGPATLLSAHLVDNGSNDTACAPFAPGAFHGKVALVTRGDCTFTEKALHVADASAIAVVVMNNDPAEAPFAMSGQDVPIPAVMVGYWDGVALQQWCETHAEAEVALHTGYVPYATSGANEVTGSSSRGPTAAVRLKPELGAPGSPILSANAYPLTSSSTQPWGWKSGTSMASPHVAGAAALVVRRYPAWTPEQVKSALVGTATRDGVTSWLGGAARPWEVGAGALRVDRLLDIRLLAEPPVVDGVELRPGEDGAVSVRLQRVAGDLAGASLRLVDGQPHPGLFIGLDAEDIVFDQQGRATVTLTIAADQSASPGDRSGWLLIEDDRDGVTVVPYLARVVPSAPDRDLLIVDLAFASANETQDYASVYEQLATDLELDWARAPVDTLFACPEVPTLERYRAVLLVTGDDQVWHFGSVASWTLDRLSTYLLRGGRLLVAGQGPLRGSLHDRLLAILGTGTLDSRPLYDPMTGGLRVQSEYRVKLLSEPYFATGQVHLTSGVGNLSMVGELAQVAAQTDLDSWARPVFRLTDGNFAGQGDVGMIYDPFPLWGHDSLAEAHGHRAVFLGFGLELVAEPEPTGSDTPVPGSAGEILHRAFQWVSDRVRLQVEPVVEGLDLSLEIVAEADSGPVTNFWLDPGDGTEPQENSQGPMWHRFPAYGSYEVTLVARSATGAAALWRRVLPVQPEAIPSDPVDGGVDSDAAGDATILEGKRHGCRCQGSPGGGGLGLCLMLGLLVGLRARRRTLLGKGKPEGERPWGSPMRLGPTRPNSTSGGGGRLLSVGAILLGCAVVLPSCEREAGKLKDAYEEVLDYSMEYRSSPTLWKNRPLPRDVWAARDNQDDRQRPVFEVDIVVPMDETATQWEARITEAARAAKAASAMEVVRVQAWVEGVLYFGGVVGVGFLAGDGRGWDGQNGPTPGGPPQAGSPRGSAPRGGAPRGGAPRGGAPRGGGAQGGDARGGPGQESDGQGNTFRGVQVVRGHAPDVWRPSAFDLEVLRALERRRLRILDDPQNERRRAQWERVPALLDRETLAQVAPEFGLTLGSVEAVVANARKFFWPPRWQPSVTQSRQ